jgi:hypothetical protein
MVKFNDSNADRIPEPRRIGYQETIRQAIESSRPADETWTLVTRQSDDGLTVTFELSRNFEAPRAFTWLAEDDDTELPNLYRAARAFLRHHWSDDRGATKH